MEGQKAENYMSLRFSSKRQGTKIDIFNNVAQNVDTL